LIYQRKDLSGSIDLKDGGNDWVINGILKPSLSHLQRDISDTGARVRNDIQAAPISQTFNPEYLKNVPVIGLHNVITESEPNQHGANRVSELDTQISSLIKQGYKIQSLRQIASSNTPPDEKTIALTFDDCYQGWYENLLPILKKYDIQATLFVNPGLLDTGTYGEDVQITYLNSKDLKDGYNKGYFDVQSHSLDHVSLVGLSKKELQEQLLTSQKVLRELLGDDPLVASMVAFPHGKYDWEVLDEASKHYSTMFGYDGQVRNIKQYGDKSVVSRTYSIKQAGIGNPSLS